MDNAVLFPVTPPEAGEGSPKSQSSSSSSSALPPPLTTPVILSRPCATCTILDRRCSNCVLAPYFPPTEPTKFNTLHSVYGGSNIIKLLEELPEAQRADAVNSMVYEANARLRDPVCGSAGAIYHLQNYKIELQVELAKAQAQILQMQCQNANLLHLVSKQSSTIDDQGIALPQSSMPSHGENLSYTFYESISSMSLEEPFWT